MNSNTTFAHVFFHFRTEIHHVCYYITVNVTILYYSYTCAQYLDVQTKLRYILWKIWVIHLLHKRYFLLRST